MDLINADCCEIENLIEGHNATQLLVQVEVLDGKLQLGEGNRILPLAGMAGDRSRPPRDGTGSA